MTNADAAHRMMKAYKALELLTRFFSTAPDPYVQECADAVPRCFFCGHVRPEHNIGCVYVEGRGLLYSD